jgi:hypothetical protein
MDLSKVGLFLGFMRTMSTENVNDAMALMSFTWLVTASTYS